MQTKTNDVDNTNDRIDIETCIFRECVHNNNNTLSSFNIIETTIVLYLIRLATRLD